MDYSRQLSRRAMARANQVRRSKKCTVLVSLSSVGCTRREKHIYHIRSECSLLRMDILLLPKVLLRLFHHLLFSAFVINLVVGVEHVSATEANVPQISGDQTPQLGPRRTFSSQPLA